MFLRWTNTDKLNEYVPMQVAFVNNHMIAENIAISQVKFNVIKLGVRHQEYIESPAQCIPIVIFRVSVFYWKFNIKFMNFHNTKFLLFNNKRLDVFFDVALASLVWNKLKQYLVANLKKKVETLFT